MNDPTRFVLIATRHPGNVGAVARSMKVMGYRDLVLVAPHDPGVLRHPEAQAFASGAGDILDAARVVPTLDEALAGISFICATAMTPRDFGPPTRAPRDALGELAGQRHRVAFLFGSERFGMGNAEVYRSHVCLSIPTAPDYGSLNLAQAVQLVAYEWRTACGAFPVVGRTPDPKLADDAALEGLLVHWRRMLVAVDFLDPAAPRKLMPRLRQLLNRAVPTQEDVQILRGVARSVERALGRRPSDPGRREPEPPALT